MDPLLKSNLSILKKNLRKDWDCCIIIDGRVGSGKSVLGLQVARYFDPEFSEKNIVYTGAQFMEFVKNAKPYSCVVFDEAIRGLYARGAMSRQNKEIVKMLNECRQKNLALILIIPSVFDLDRSIVLHRANCLINVYSVGAQDRDGDYFLKRGYFGFYGPNRLKNLYINGKKNYNYKAWRSRFSGKFPHVYTIPENIYRKHKENNFLAENFEDENENEQEKGPTVDIQKYVSKRQ